MNRSRVSNLYTCSCYVSPTSKGNRKNIFSRAKPSKDGRRASDFRRRSIVFNDVNNDFSFIGYYNYIDNLIDFIL